MPVAYSEATKVTPISVNRIVLKTRPKKDIKIGS
jgi:hypothetical protein